MTREDAIKTLKENCCAMCAYGSQDMDSCDIRSCDIKDAINALEQEPFMNKPCISVGVCEHDKMQVLDKIRAEIEQNAYPIVHGVNNHEKGMTLYGILQIIDKYKNGEQK